MVAPSSRGSQLPSWGSAERMISKSPSGIQLELVDAGRWRVDAIPAMTCSPTYRAEPRLPHRR